MSSVLFCDFIANWSNHERPLSKTSVKSSKTYKTDLSRDEGWQPLGALGYEGVRMIAIDDDWSAFRLRHVSNIKALTRRNKMVMSQEGKQRTKKG